MLLWRTLPPAGQRVDRVHNCDLLGSVGRELMGCIDRMYE